MVEERARHGAARRRTEWTEHSRSIGGQSSELPEYRSEPDRGSDPDWTETTLERDAAKREQSSGLERNGAKREHSSGLEWDGAHGNISCSVKPAPI